MSNPAPSGGIDRKHTMRPKFLDQPIFSQRTPRVNQSRADYASPVVINTRSRWRMPDLVVAIVLVVVCAGIGVMLGWRG